MGSGLACALKRSRQATLDQLEVRFSAVLPQSLFPKSADGANSRARIYTQWRTFWSALWQVLTPGTPDRAVVRQLQALGVLGNSDPIAASDSAYCQARARLSGESLAKALAATAAAAEHKAPTLAAGFLQNRPVKAVDGCAITLPDSPENRQAYPKVQSPKNKEAAVFPMLRMRVLFSLASGAILSALTGSLVVCELALLRQLLGQLQSGDILLGDRGFGNFVVLSLLQKIGVDFIGRSKRGVDGRKRQQRLGRNDWLLTWRKSASASTVMSLAEWDLVPKEMTVRIVVGRYQQKGFRLRQVTLVTTLLDPQLYPAEEILRAYGRRWRLEMCLDDLKTTLGMAMLSWKRPPMVQKELQLHLIAHNLVRLVMAESARAHDRSIERLSFKGTLDALKEFGKAMGQARSKQKREELRAHLWRAIAEDEVPERPGRREPRAVKRVKRKYPRLNQPRHKFVDWPKRHERRRTAKNLRNLNRNP